MSIFKIAGGIGLALLGLSMLSVLSLPAWVTGIFLLVAGIALLFDK